MKKKEVRRTMRAPMKIKENICAAFVEKSIDIAIRK